MARLELERGTDVLLLETGDSLLLEGNPVLVTPATLALILTTYAPTVTITANQLVTPSTLALTLTTYVPTVTASDHQTVTPTTLALTLTTYAPSVIIRTIVTPSTLALILTTYPPKIEVKEAPHYGSVFTGRPNSDRLGKIMDRNKWLIQHGEVPYRSWDGN